MSAPETFLCNLCPRRCNAPRTAQTGSGYCALPALPAVCRAALHFGEEPCISGSRGSGTVFFCGCTLRCVFCQNEEISRGYCGTVMDADALARTFLSLQEQGAQNLNLVTATPFALTVAEALKKAKLKIPVVWNTSGYERVETLRMLEGLVQIYLPDCKYATARAGEEYSDAPDYAETVTAALTEMLRQVGTARFDGEGNMTSGVLVRHLVLPGELRETLAVIGMLKKILPPDTPLSLLRQYTPPAHPAHALPKNLTRRVTTYEYEKAVEAALDAGFTRGYTQEKDSATAAYVPVWDMVAGRKETNLHEKENVYE